MHYGCPKKGCNGSMEYMKTTKDGDMYKCKMCGKKAYYEGSDGFDVDIPGL